MQLVNILTVVNAMSCRFDELRKSEASIDMDGLNTLTYHVLDYQEMPLYTFLSVSLR